MRNTIRISALKIPFHKPYITDDEISAVTGTLRSGWTTMGEVTRSFENEFKSYLGAEEAVALNSCTAALHLAMIAAGIGSTNMTQFRRIPCRMTSRYSLRM